MTGCRCCVFLMIFTLSVVFGKSFPKHVSLVKARFGDVLGSGGREPLAGAKTSTCRSSRSGSNSCYWGLCGWAPVRIGVNSAFEQCFRLCFDIEAYCPCIFGNRDLVEPGAMKQRPSIKTSGSLEVSGSLGP
ncbi:unnamed protein product [Effrenium voratum]|uniref:Secreted protein n=1 Tax=Effrenium voratum TaxID=2562239 RepID=A0AA36IL69_9DINO|nr:unnamed protein product [Effrenium voratum]